MKTNKIAWFQTQLLQVSQSALLACSSFPFYQLSPIATVTSAWTVLSGGKEGDQQ